MDKNIQITNKSNWDHCLVYIKDRIPDLAFQTWFVSIKLSSVTDEEIVLQVPNKFHYEWLESKYRLLIDDAIKTTFSHAKIVNYSIVISEKKPASLPTIRYLPPKLCPTGQPLLAPDPQPTQPAARSENVKSRNNTLWDRF